MMQNYSVSIKRSKSFCKHYAESSFRQMMKHVLLDYSIIEKNTTLLEGIS